MNILPGILLAGILAAFLVFLGNQVGTPEGFSYSISGCQEQVPAEIKAPAQAGINLQLNGSQLLLSQNLSYVCCANLKLEIEKSGEVIKLLEKNIGEICKCICVYQISAEIPWKGEKRIEIWGVEHADHPAKLLWQKEIVPESFCGRSTFGPCQSDADCRPGGCSGEICQSVQEEPVFSICEFRECYQVEGISCRCVEGKCQWSL
ncbi:MAG: hypothetical protein DRP12_01335 [Candidatus Aenigmatarchaeota archaeon]|nr:MAG: hypothetical protein DRP12_01335 [Candidatus Aenigmarchaeota archaeon]